MLSEELMYRRRMLMSKKEEQQIDPSVVYEAFNLSFNGSNYIDTGVYLFTQENINKDFEFIAENITGPTNQSSNTLICAKYDSAAYGFLIRTTGNNNTQYKGTIFVKGTPNYSTAIVKRVNGVITLSGTNVTNPNVQFNNNVHNWPLVLGCAIDNNGNPYRYAKGKIGHIVVRWL